MSPTFLALLIVATVVALSVRPRRWTRVEGRLVRREVHNRLTGGVEVVGVYHYFADGRVFETRHRVASTDPRLAVRDLPGVTTLLVDTENPGHVAWAPVRVLAR